MTNVEAGVMDQEMRSFERALLALDRQAVEAQLDRLLERTDRIAAVEGLVIPILESVGERWERGELALSQVYMCGRLCERAVDRILPPADPRRSDQPPTAIAVLEDHHLLGKRMVYSALRARGFEVKDYGRRTVASLTEAVETDAIEVLMVSVLMLPSALRVRDLRQRLDELPRPPHLIVGGAPFLFDDELAAAVGADAVGRNSADGISLLAAYCDAAGRDGASGGSGGNGASGGSEPAPHTGRQI